MQQQNILQKDGTAIKCQSIEYYIREVWNRKCKCVGPERKAGSLAEPAMKSGDRLDLASRCLVPALYSLPFQSKTSFSLRCCRPIPLLPTFFFIGKYSFIIPECEVLSKWF